MKFIRDIINEKKQAAVDAEYDLPDIGVPPTPPAQSGPAPQDGRADEAPLILSRVDLAEPDIDPEPDAFDLLAEEEPADTALRDDIASLFRSEAVAEVTPQPAVAPPASAIAPTPRRASTPPAPGMMPKPDPVPPEPVIVAPPVQMHDAGEPDALGTTRIVTRDPVEEPPVTAPVEMPAPSGGRAARRGGGRVKTRLLGFGQADEGDADPFAQTPATGTAQPGRRFPVGWLAVVQGDGRGTVFTLFSGVSQIGRGEDQDVRLDFGDTSISRASHAVLAYDGEQQAFFLGHGGKANLVRLNDRPVLSTETLKSGDRIRVGETTLHFVGLCGPGFDWAETENSEGRHALGR